MSKAESYVALLSALDSGPRQRWKEMGRSKIKKDVIFKPFVFLSVAWILIRESVFLAKNEKRCLDKRVSRHSFYFEELVKDRL